MILCHTDLSLHIRHVPKWGKMFFSFEKIECQIMTKCSVDEKYGIIPLICLGTEATTKGLFTDFVCESLGGSFLIDF